MSDLHANRARRRRRRRVVTVVLTVILVAALAGGGWWWITASRARAERAAAETLVADFASAYARRDLTGIPSSASDMAERFATATEDMGEAQVSVEPGPVIIDETGARSDLAVTWTLPGDVTWEYSTRVDLSRPGTDDPLWRVE